jgi:hypothetical protein
MSSHIIWISYGIFLYGTYRIFNYTEIECFHSTTKEVDSWFELFPLLNWSEEDISIDTRFHSPRESQIPLTRFLEIDIIVTYEDCSRIFAVRLFTWMKMVTLTGFSYMLLTESLTTRNLNAFTLQQKMLTVDLSYFPFWTEAKRKFLSIIVSILQVSRKFH